MQSELLNALYSRHTEKLQRSLLSSRVAVCGLGGIGSHTAVFLARLGVGNLHIIDFDVVDVSNIHRQSYFPHQIGMKKTDALKNIINSISPFTQVICDDAALGRDNIPSLLKNDEIICECFDSAEAKAELSDTVLTLMPEKYVIAVSGVAGANGANDIKTKRITDRFYLCGDGVSDVEGSCLFAPKVALCSAHQALTVLQIIKERNTK